MTMLKDILTMLAAAIGAGLGVYNFFHGRTMESVRLRVTPKSASFYGRTGDGHEAYVSSADDYSLDGAHPADTLAIEVINLSKFPVTVDEVGLIPRTGNRMAVGLPILPDNGTWPRKLEPRDSVTVHFDPTKLLGQDGIETVTKAYASTICGATVKGTSGALRDFVRIAAGIRS